MLEAGRYTEAEAKAEASVDPSCMSAHRLAEFMPEPNENRDSQLTGVGKMQAAISTMDAYRPKDPAALHLWASARDLAHTAMVQEWSAALRASPVEVPK